jgi:glycosyltransferase involved in cell wall biosynthesis
MKTLFINRPKNKWIGGDYVLMEHLAKELVKLGVGVDISETPAISPAIMMRQYDIVHTFNFTMDWSKMAVWISNLWKKKTVATMIYHENELYTTYKEQQIMITGTDKCIFTNDGELARAKRHLEIPKEKIAIIPNGIDDYWFQDIKSNDKSKFIFSAGRLDGTKGQLEVARACNILKLKYVCAGEVIDKKYAKRCDMLGAILCGSLTQEEMIKMYASCMAVVVNSKTEIMSMVGMEAMAQGKPIVMSDTNEWIPEGVFVCKYNDHNSVAKEIKKAMKLDKVEYDLSQFKWETMAKKVKEIYEQILN